MVKKFNRLLSIAADPGSSGGGVAVITSDLDILELRTAPFYITRSTKQNKAKLNKETGKFEKDFKKRTWTDPTKLREIYLPYVGNDIIYTVEKVFVKNHEGAMGSFIFGASWGIHTAQCSLLNPIAFYEPTPTEWKDVFSLSSDKELSVIMANQIFEKQLKKKMGTLLKFQKSNNNKNADLAEALLMAFFGLNKYLESK